jgi:hypothetical protein
MRYNNIFECKIPTLQEHEDEILYTHPSHYWLQVNQIGIRYIDYDELQKLDIEIMVDGRDMMKLYDKKNNEVITLRNRLATCYECYHAVPKINSRSLVHVNHNIYDFRPENIKDKKNINQNWIYEHFEFYYQTYQKMLEIDKKIFRVTDKSNIEIWKLIGLPPEVLCMYNDNECQGTVNYFAKKKYANYKIKSSPKIDMSGDNWNREWLTFDGIETMMAKKMTITEMAKQANCSSTKIQSTIRAYNKERVKENINFLDKQERNKHIFESREAGEKYVSIAKRLGLSHITVSNICKKIKEAK